MNLKANLASPTFTGTVTLPKITSGDASFNGRVDICGNFYAQYPAASIPSSAIIGGAGGGSSIDLSVDISVNGLTIGCGTNDISTNSVVGYQALLSNTTGYQNSAFGFQALLSNTTGYFNVANGFQALMSNTTGNFNVANGLGSLYSNTTGQQHVANGYQALYSNTTGQSNTANGVVALRSNTTGYYNTANGGSALYANTTGNNNSANGFQTLYANTTGNNNTANGYEALRYNTTGQQNAANGYRALYLNTTGSNNSASGYQAGYNNNTGTYNTFLGSNTDTSGTTWSSSTAIGANAKITASNQIILGTSMETVFVPGKLTIIGDASFNGRVDICGNFYAQYPAASIPISAINGISSPTFAQVDASLNLKANLVSPTFTGIVTLPKVTSGDASFNGNVDISGVLSVKQTVNSVVTNTTVNNYNVAVTNDISLNGNLIASGKITAASFASSSDYRIKSNVISLSDCSFEIDALNPVTYHNKITNRDDIGFIAHELQSHIPFLVTGEKDGDAIQTVNYTGIIGLLVHELQQLKKNVVPNSDQTYRGSVQLINGVAQVNLDNQFNMPDGTFSAFKDVAVFTTNETGWDPVRGGVSGNILTIECIVNTVNAQVSYLVVAKTK